MSGWHVKMMGKLRSITSTCDIRYVADFAVSQRLYRAYADTWLLMAAHSNGQAIIFCSCGFYLSSSCCFFVAYSQRSKSGCTPYFHTWCGLKAHSHCARQRTSTSVDALVVANYQVGNNHVFNLHMTSWTANVWSKLCVKERFYMSQLQNATKIRQGKMRRGKKLHLKSVFQVCSL